MTAAAPLSAEWERIELLASCIAAARGRREVGEKVNEQLEGLQHRVQEGRKQPPWSGVIEARRIDRIEQDILACALAPNAEPALGSVFQALQPSTSSPYPSAALLRELLFLDPAEADAVHLRLRPTAALIAGGLIERRSTDFFEPVRPTSRANADLLGWSGVGDNAPPGATEIPCTTTLNDLVLPAACLAALRNLLVRITHKDIVVDRWGGRAHGGPLALLSGPSGTGKTFAAEAIAGELGWPLYRVDLGMLVSKYIGETEKNLSSLLDAAHGRPMVLLFDEADALFGKRGEVRDARDRYANMEVSHLLTRVERHQGPCILTSNLRRNLDVAFARRFQAVVEFPRPDVPERLRLWKKYLPPRAPYEPDMRIELLATALQLTGGQIANVALQAAFNAAGEGRAIALGHVAQAVRTEFLKSGSEFLSSSLGPLAAHLPHPRLEGASC